MRERCAACEALQPIDYAPGDACTSCGVVFEAETICAGCAARTSAGRFCRRCGCELPDAADFGAARMLRAAGVDAFSLRARLAALEPEQRDTLTRRFEAERVVIARVVDERAELAARLERSLGVRAFEDAWLAAIPLGDTRLAALRASDGGDELARVYATSPEPTHRAWAATALVLAGAGDVTAEVLAACVEPPELAVCALALHPTHPRWGDHAFRRRAAELAAPLATHARWGPYAALALTLVADRRAAARPETIEALQHGTRSAVALLAFRCGLALGDDAAVRGGLALPAVRVEALRWLAARGHADAIELAGDAIGGVLSALPAPVPRPLVARLLAILPTAEAREREIVVAKLAVALAPDELAQVIAIAVERRDGRMFNALLRAAAPAPAAPLDAEPVARAIVDHDLFGLGWVLDACCDAARAGRVGDLGALLDRARGDTRIGVMRMCDALAEAPRALLDRGIRIALGPASAPTRVAAAVWLEHEKRKRPTGDHGWPDLFTLGAADATRVFGSVDAALAIVRATFADRAGMTAVSFYDWLAGVLRTTQPDLAAAVTPDALRAYLDALLAVVRDRELWAILRGYAASSVWKLATSDAGRTQRAWMIATLAAARSADTDIDYWLQRTLDELA